MREGAGQRGRGEKKNELRGGGSADGSVGAAPEPRPSAFQEMKEALAQGAAAVQASAAVVRQSGRPHAVAESDGGASAVARQPVVGADEAAVLPQGAAAIWAAVRARLVADNKGSVDSILASRSMLVSCDAGAGEATVEIPAQLENYLAGPPEEALGEAFSAVLGRTVRVSYVVSEAAQAMPRVDAARQASAVAQRVPPELLEAVRATPVVKRIIETLGGDVTGVEVLGGGGSDGRSELVK